ncbi:MAG: hypothetical protein Q9227_000655 [Pyrenula ochraceoflavens]
MACSVGSLTVESSEYPSTRASSTSRDTPEEPLLRGRRHSYHTIRRRQSSICDSDALFVRVDLFLNELETRLAWLQDYKQASFQQVDAKLKQGYAALEAVRDSCSYASGELIWGAARQRTRILVETLEDRYKDVIATKTTLEQKAQASMRLLETYLSELEARAHAKQTDFTNAVEKGMKRVDSSISHAREVVDEGLDRARQAKESLKEAISHALQRAHETRLILYQDLPHPWRVNPHILRGYRFSESPLECITSVFRPSNETVNIWSHAIGLVIVLAIAFYFYPSSAMFPSSSKADILITAVFFIAACKCLICSTMWHTMNSIADKTLLDRFACVDYTGISFLIAASILSSEWTAFYCEPVPRTIYMTLTVVLGIAGTILPWHPTFNRADMAWARVLFYVSLGATGFAPVIQLNITRGPEWSYYFYAPITSSIIVYLAGAVIYASQIPEKWFPGCFDYFGGSHNIWHLAVLGGILFHYMAMHEFFHNAFLRAKEIGGCSA